MKKYHVIIGHFGSGKSEFSLNIAFNEAAKGKKITLVDLDIVNPYFRTKDSAAELAAAGIPLISPAFANSNVDLPALPKEV